MRAKFIYETLRDIFRPKSEDEIMPHLGDISPNELLLTSSRIGFLSGVKLALKNGADIHARNDGALRLASENGHKNVVEFLLKNEADVHADSDIALRWASEYNHRDVVELLKKYM
jgi:ankyrin repeat protein